MTSDQSQYQLFRVMASWALICVSIFGMFVNLIPIWLVTRKKNMSNFHVLLLILSIADFVVVLGCFAIYGLTDVWPAFNTKTYPLLAPWLIPVVQMALLISVYATVILSFERYVRIVYICNLRHCKYFNEENFKFYVGTLVAFPVIFYFPKFFEFKAVQVEKAFTTQEECLEPEEDEACYLLDDNSTILMKNITKYYNRTELQFTDLRNNYYFRKIYHSVLNTLVSTVIPMLTLLYLNVSVCLAVRKKMRISRQAFQTVQTQSRSAFKVLRTSSFYHRHLSREMQQTPVMDTPAQETIELGPIREEPEVINVIDDDEDLVSPSDQQMESEGLQENQSSISSSTSRFESFLRKIFQKNEKTLTRVSVLIVWMYLACHVWKIIPNVYEALHWSDQSGTWPRWLDYVVLTSHLMIVINSSMNFLVYLIL